jgi:hypothetical protein
MSKKTNIRQTHIVTLTDYHRQEIEEINHDKENMLKEYEKKREGSFIFNKKSFFEYFCFRITITINEKRTIIISNKT